MIYSTCLTASGRGGVGFRSLRETAVDTTTAQGRLVVSILAAISEFEREIILSRITEGSKQADCLSASGGA